MSKKSSTAGPSPKGGNGSDRGGDGRFLPGNPGGPGNPYARHVAALRRALFDALTPDDVADVVAGLLRKARRGDVRAAELIFRYSIGEPAAAPAPDFAAMGLDEADLLTIESRGQSR